ncbi:MAG: hypothetical protein LLF98_13305 [Clostridium sp.]|uniref:hypothetical protein n=1 Tax=Clostridium sp. TaxID=1506 RepID=UPI0025C21357|nr:hypothetical protein [Clostridium sp.]MCE5222185.1 hypothetical protein [Clostridium sp.]
MNKLVLLSEVRKGRNKDKSLEFNKNKSVQEDSNSLYLKFKEKFEFFQNEENFMDLNCGKSNYTKCEKRLNGILKRIFSLDNKILLIELFNSIYNDDLSENTRIEYIKNKDIINSNQVLISRSANYNVRILAEDEYRKFEYQIQFQTKDDENIAIMMSKIDFNNNYDNIISLTKKRREYEKDNVSESINENYTRYLIMINSNIQVPDVYEFKSNSEGQNIDCKVNVIKSWKCDFKQLFEKNMCLLFPIKVIDLKKRLLSISQEIESKDLIKDYIFNFFKDMNKYLKKIKDNNLITDKDINEMNLITIDLLNHFIREKNNAFVDIERDIEATLKSIVV